MKKKKDEAQKLMKISVKKQESLKQKEIESKNDLELELIDNKS